MRRALIALMLFVGVAAAQESTDDAQVEQRLKTLSSELRCLVCQNQSLADSSADLAIDLRNQVRDQIKSGKSDAEIKDYLVQRYGDFVLYRPRMKAITLLLWAGPFALLVLGAGTMFLYVRRRRSNQDEAPITQEQAERVRSLLEDEPHAAQQAGDK